MDYEVAIIGGGLVGSILAKILSNVGISCIVFEKQPTEKLYTVENDNRGLALSYVSKVIFQTLGIWQDLQPSYVIDSVNVSEQRCFGSVLIKASDYDVDALGYVASSSSIAKAIYKNLYTEIIVSNKTTPTFDEHLQKWCIKYGNNDAVTAQLLVAADGSNSSIRELLHIATIGKRQGQAALVTNIVTDKIVSGKAWQRIIAQGVTAVLPFGENTFKFVFTGDVQDVLRISEYPKTIFVKWLQDALGRRCGKILSISNVFKYPLQIQRASSVTANSSVLLGNAANTLHPLAAQGYNLALRDVAMLAEVLLDAKLQGKDVASVAVLEKYKNLRQKDQERVTRLSSYLNNITHSNKYSVKLLRSFGKSIVQLFTGLHMELATQGMGLNCHLPQLALGEKLCNKMS